MDKMDKITPRPRFTPILHPRPSRYRYIPHDPALTFRSVDYEHAPYRAPERERNMKFKRETHLDVPGPKPDTRREVRFWLKKTPFWRRVCPQKVRPVDGMLTRCVSEGGRVGGGKEKERRLSFGGW